MRVNQICFQDNGFYCWDVLEALLFDGFKVCRSSVDQRRLSVWLLFVFPSQTAALCVKFVPVSRLKQRFCHPYMRSRITVIYTQMDSIPSSCTGVANVLLQRSGWSHRTRIWWLTFLYIEEYADVWLFTQNHQSLNVTNSQADLRDSLLFTWHAQQKITIMRF